ncbi:MAG: SPFH domain-containing protein [Imperialibacter sp.]|uniref:flotillin family protein n=1 Tax=Imperialibacter sp. TaxID=2038411 RepID=UPI0032EAFA44
MSVFALPVVAIVALFIFIILITFFSRYKRCPSDRVMVVYGKVGGGTDGHSSSKCIHGGAAFVWPVFQDYAFLDLTPNSIEVNLTNALSKQNIRVDVPSRFTVGISTETGVMENAAERLLGLTKDHIHDLAKDIIFGQLRLVVAMMDIEEINSNRDKFLANVASNVEAELKKIGLKLINVNVTDIKDESGYIEALGKEAAAKAINDARKSVAEKTRDGSIGEAMAHQDQRVQVADANALAKIGEANAAQKERIQIANADSSAKVGESEALAKANIGEAEAQKTERIQTSEANARAVEGENKAKIDIANSEAERREKEAEALRKAMAAEKVKQAKALEESYAAEQAAENARAQRDKASQTANIVVPAEIDKLKVEIAAEAEAEMIRRRAKGEADSIIMRREAEARGIYEVLTKQAEGLKQIVNAAGNSSKDAAMLIIAEKLPELVRLQSEAIKNIQIEKITVWDSGTGKDGKTSTANFLSGMYQSVPPLKEIFEMAGLELPAYLGEAAKKVAATEVKETTSEKKEEKPAETKPSHPAKGKDDPKKGPGPAPKK